MQTSQDAFNDFIKRLTHLISKNPHLIKVTLSNIFSMRLIGNKTHGDLAEIAIPEFVNQFMYDFKAKHVGKELYRSKKHEEDILITNEIHKIDFPISLKAYGYGPLQLSTDKNFQMFTRLQKEGPRIVDQMALATLFDDPAFSEFGTVNVLPLIYRERQKLCNIMVFDFRLAKAKTSEIRLIPPQGRRKHPVYIFYNDKGQYICEVRYGNQRANALQRGLWTDTRRSAEYFNSVTNGWIDYSDNPVLVKFFAYALVSTSKGHEKAIQVLESDIQSQKDQSFLNDAK